MCGDAHRPRDPGPAGALGPVRGDGGASWTTIRGQVTGNAEKVTKVRDRLIAEGALVNRRRGNAKFNLWTADDPAARSEAGTGLEPVPVSPREGLPEPVRSAVPPIRGTAIGTERVGSAGA